MTFLADRLAGEITAKVAGSAFKILVIGAQNQSGNLMVKFPQLPVFVARGAVFIQRGKGLIDQVTFITFQTGVVSAQLPTGAGAMAEQALFPVQVAFRAIPFFMA